MEQHLQSNVLSSNAGLDELSKSYLQQTVRWTKFLAIMGFIAIGAMMLFSLIFIFAGGAIAQYSKIPFAGVLGVSVFGVVYLAITALYAYPIFCLYKFTRCMKYGLMADDQMQITEAFRYQRNMYRFMGILMLIMLGIYALIFVFGIIGAAVGGLS